MPDPKKRIIPHAPIPPASGFGVGFGYLNTFQEMGYNCLTYL